MKLIRVGGGNPCSHQDISEFRPSPTAVHDSAISPIDPLDLLEQGPHRMATVSSALQRTSDIVLRKVILKLRDGEFGFLPDCAVYMNDVCLCSQVWDWTVITVIAPFGSKKTTI